MGPDIRHAGSDRRHVARGGRGGPRPRPKSAKDGSRRPSKGPTFEDSMSLFQMHHGQGNSMLAHGGPASTIDCGLRGRRRRPFFSRRGRDDVGVSGYIRHSVSRGHGRLSPRQFLTPAAYAGPRQAGAGRLPVHHVDAGDHAADRECLDDCCEAIYRPAQAPRAATTRIA